MDSLLGKCVSRIMMLIFLHVGAFSLAFGIHSVGYPSETGDTKIQGTVRQSYLYGDHTVYIGDLIVDGNKTFIIENCIYVLTGNIYVRDNACLIIRNAELRFNQTSDWQCSIRVNMSGICETRDAILCNHVNPSYSFGMYFYGNSTPLIINSTIEKYVFCPFPSESSIQGNIYIHDSEIERIQTKWIHNVFINCSSVGSLEITRGGTLHVRPIINLLHSNIGVIEIRDFGGTLTADESIIGDFSLGGGLYIFGNLTFTGSVSVRYGFVKRNFNIISVDEASYPMENVRLRLYSRLGTSIWNGSTDSSGKANFELMFTNSNYTNTLRLEAVKEDYSFEENINLSSETPIMITIPYTPIHNLDTGLNYSTIQGAIDAPETLDGHTIFVEEGIYYENIVVNKTVSFIGENRNFTVIDGNNAEVVIQLKSNNTRIEGFTLQNGYHGVSISPWTSGHTIINNKIQYNMYGISGHYDVFNITIFGNIITSNNITGIKMLFANSQITKNLISDNGKGEFQEYSSGIQIVLGVNSHVFYCVNNTIYNNTIKNHRIGIWEIHHSEENYFFHNNFINNTIQAYLSTDSKNYWNNNCEGNYWSNYNGTDLDGDGIGDTPYIIDQNSTDVYPLMNLYWHTCDINHDLKVDMKDVGTSTRAFNTEPGDSDWNCHVDITGSEYLKPDHIVNMRDIGLIARNFGETY